ncbi:endonuclease I family protein [Bacillus massiliglaciei]|uniref:endonuclease I family protein n=1 Tax=Bacillus massiliglaciei TaxID=1816693 RepID=UPI000DA624D6
MKGQLSLAEQKEKSIELLQISRNRPYYEPDKEKVTKHSYYGNELVLPDLQTLVQKTHQHFLPYSPHKYVYPWVDLQENGELKSLYSGIGMEPAEVIVRDLAILSESERSGDHTILAENKLLNCEHVVPQSWFEKRNPMRGDLHHLFACEPGCNSSRGNFPYFDFEDYLPEKQVSGIKDGCGKSEKGRFEPEYGKGIVARASLYFLLRYEDSIDPKLLNLNTLIDWHQSFPVSLYEQHRNMAIYELQGNRNPFIDYPEYACDILEYYRYL